MAVFSVLLMTSMAYFNCLHICSLFVPRAAACSEWNPSCSEWLGGPQQPYLLFMLYSNFLMIPNILYKKELSYQHCLPHEKPSFFILYVSLPVGECRILVDA